MNTLQTAMKMANVVASNQATAATSQHYRKRWQDKQEQLEERFLAGGSPRRLLQQNSRWTDDILCSIWQHHLHDAPLALIAVGGYGRGELHPASDIDLLILKKSRLAAHWNQHIESFVMFLWDIGLEVGHSVRSIRECVVAAKADITIMTNLIESRYLSGQKTLYETLSQRTTTDKLWSSRKFFIGKFAEQQTRHKKFSHTEHNLEPNIKEYPGGLRDIHTIAWIAKRHFGISHLRDLITLGFLSREEYQVLNSGQSLLEKIRFALHLLTKRREDRLLFEHQRNVAALLGFRSTGQDLKNNHEVEAFMKMYYQTARKISCINEILLQHFQEAILYANRKEKIKTINTRFQIRQGFIEVTRPDVFTKTPSALLEIFLLIQQYPSVQGIRAQTARLLRKDLKKINPTFRRRKQNQQLFMEIIKQPRHVGHELRRMHRYGILEAYIPKFRRIQGQMQFDLFHAYTVDEHTLFVIQNLRRFGLADYVQQHPLCHAILQTLPKKELLYIAGLYHDIAKGRGGDHAVLGAIDARNFCTLHGLNEYDTKLVAWLVQEHLLIPHTAQKKDIYDPYVVHEFASIVRDKIHLDYLYLLTVADVSATNPALWNSWKSTLFSDLYRKAANILRQGLDTPIDTGILIQEMKHSLLRKFSKCAEEKAALEKLWCELDDDYFMRHTEDEILWHSSGILDTPEDKLPLVLIRHKTERGGSEIFVYTKDKQYLFAATTKAMSSIGLNIVDARIITSKDGYVLDTYIVLESDQRASQNKTRDQEIRHKISAALQHPNKYIKRITRRQKNQVVFPVQLQVDFVIDKKHQRTLMIVTANNRPGFLSIVSVALVMCGVRLQGARIVTYGERAEDIFYITNQNHKPITQHIKFECLRNSVVEMLQ